MADTISNTRGIGGGLTRYAPTPASATEPVRPVVNAGDQPQHEHGEGGGHAKHHAQEDDTALRLEIAENPADGELIYRFVDPRSGAVVRQWDSRDLGRLRDYVRAQRIHLVDRKV